MSSSSALYLVHSSGLGRQYVRAFCSRLPFSEWTSALSTLVCMRSKAALVSGRVGCTDTSCWYRCDAAPRRSWRPWSSSLSLVASFLRERGAGRGTGTNAEVR